MTDESDEYIDQVVSRLARPESLDDQQFRESVAKLLEIWGQHKFELLYGLKEPKNSRERNLVEFHRSLGDSTEREEILRSFAERPVDEEMLDEVHAQAEQDLQLVGDFLQAVVMAANECDQNHDARARIDLEKRANEACDRLSGKSEIYSSELITCGEFLADLNSNAGCGVIELAGISANSYHEVVARMRNFVVKSWKNCSDIAHESQFGTRYAYEVSASSLFMKNSFDSIPRPQQVYARLEDEHRRALREIASIAPVAERNRSSDIKILESIDSGLYGKVYKGIQTSLGRHVAVKIVKDLGVPTADVVDHAKLLVRVDHPAIVTVYAVQEVFVPQLDQEFTALIMEWLEGEPFGRRLAGTRFTVLQAIQLCRDVIDGVAALHDAGICHGDLNVGNVIVLPDQRAKIIDIDANKEVSLSRMSTQLRKGAISSDVDYCRGIIFKTLRHTTLSLAQLEEMDPKLSKADSIESLAVVLRELANQHAPGHSESS